MDEPGIWYYIGAIIIAVLALGIAGLLPDKASAPPRSSLDL